MNTPPPLIAPTKPELVVAISALGVTDDPNAVLLTHALGSCVGVIAHCRRLGVGGLLHFMLPAAPRGSAATRAAMYGDTGILALFQELERRGCRPHDLVVKLAGGGVFNDPKGFFAIGERNVRAAVEALRSLGLAPLVQDVGGQRSRTVRLEVSTGLVVVRSKGEEYRL